MLDEVSAQSVGISHEVAQSSSSVSTSFFFSIFEQFNKQGHTWLEMLVEDVIMEASISDCKASKLSCVPVWVLATLNRSGDQTKLEQLFVEEARVPAEVSNQIADLCADRSVLVNYKGL